MKVLVVGGTGTIGAAVVDALRAAGHEVRTAERSGGELQVDMRSTQSVQAMLAQAGRVDAIMSCAGSGAWKPLAELSDDDFETSLHYKLMGQVNLARYGADSLADGTFLPVRKSGAMAMNPSAASWSATARIQWLTPKISWTTMTTPSTATNARIVVAKLMPQVPSPTRRSRARATAPAGRCPARARSPPPARR